MKTKQHLLTVFVILMVFMLVLSACGKLDAKPTASVNSSTAPAAVQPSATPEAVQSSLDQIKKSGKLVIGVASGFRPIDFPGENGELIGYDIDWGNLIAEGLGVKAEYVEGAFSGLVPGLVADKYDTIMAALVITPERQEVIDFSEPYLTDGGIAVVRKDNTTITDVTNLKGLTVGVIGGSGFMDDVKNIGGYKKIIEYPGANEAFRDLKAGRIDVYVVGKSGASDFIAQDKSDVPLKMVGELYNAHHSAIGIHKDEKELKAAIDKIITEKKQDGTFDKISQKWFGYIMPK